MRGDYLVLVLLGRLKLCHLELSGAAINSDDLLFARSRGYKVSGVSAAGI